MKSKTMIKLQSEQHEIINPEFFASHEEYVLHLMHLSDYQSAQKIVEGKIVLDLGCNSGYGTHILSQKSKKIVGVDVSPSAIETARIKYAADNLVFELVDGIELPFNDNSFDVVTSFQVIEHLEDYDSYFNEIKRVLRPDGVLLLTTPNAEIRVHPDQRPWNRFHVHEFRGRELGEFLSKYFLYTEILAQFARGSAYSTEYTRCIRMRDAVATPKKMQFRKFIVNALPAPVATRLRRLKAIIFSRKTSFLSETEKNKYSLDDFYYTKADHNACLSLVACCSNNKISLVKKCVQAFHAGNE